MPPLEPVPDTARCVVSLQHGTFPIVNVIHVRLNPPVGSISAADLVFLANGVHSAFGTHLMPLVSTATILQDVTCTDLSSNTGQSASSTNADVQGGQGGNTLPISNAMCISWKENLRYRGGHARTYLAVVTFTQLASVRSFSAAAITSANAQVAAFRTAINALVMPSARGTALAVVHRTRNKVKLSPAEVQLITSGVVDTRVDSQRRRLGADVPA